MTAAENVQRKKLRGGQVRRLLDAAAALTPRRAPIGEPRRIGILLSWGVGDSVQTLPLLQAVRRRWPQAEIVALGKSWLEELMGDEGLFDAYADLTPPWTRHLGKYRLWDRHWLRFRGQIVALRRYPFDLLIGVRPDPRDVLLARLLRPRAYAGLAVFGGGNWISCDLGRGLDDPGNQPGPALAAHAALQLTGLEAAPVARFAGASARPAPREAPVLAVAFGASHPIRRWNGPAISRVLAGVRARPGKLIAIDHEDGPDFAAPPSWDLERWRGNLHGLKAMLAGIDVVFCTDSGVMHIADAAGCKVVTLFTSGNISRFAPPGQSIYAVEPMPCRPCGDHCIYPVPLCVERIDEAAVSALLERALNEV